MFESIYHIIELMDGEKGFRLIPYRLAETIKLFLLKFIN